MDFSQKKVLIVDDHDGLRGLFRALLEKAGFKGDNILLAENGDVGLAVYDSEIGFIDIVITDTHMKRRNGTGMDGPEMMKGLRDRGYDGPIIQVSSQDQDISHHGKNDSFVRKDITGELIYKVEELLSQSPSALKLQDQKKRILLVDDDVDIREGVKDFLVYNGYEVEETEDGQQALAMVNGKGREAYDAIISDLNMPIMDGPTLLAQLRLHMCGYQNGFISHSCRDLKEQKMLYSGLNPDAFLEKGDNKALLRMLADVLEKYKNPNQSPPINTAPAVERPPTPGL